MSLYPKTLYHKTAIPKRVWTEDAEKQAKEQGWVFPSYQRQEFPKTMYHATKKPQIVDSAEAQKALGSQWFDKPQEGNLTHVDPATVADADHTEMLERCINPDLPGAMQLLRKARREDAEAQSEEPRKAKRAS